MIKVLETARENYLPTSASRLPVLGGAIVASLGALLTAWDPQIGVAFILGVACLVALLTRMDLLLYGIVGFAVIFIDGWAPTRSPDDVVFRLGIGRLYIMEFAVYGLFCAYLLKRLLDGRGSPRRPFFVSTAFDRPLLVFAALLPAYAVYGLARGHLLQDAMGYYEWRSLLLAIAFYFLTVNLVDTRTRALRLFWWFLGLAGLKAVYFLVLYFLDSEGVSAFALGLGPVDEGPENYMFVFAALAAIALLLFSSKVSLWKRSLIFLAAAAPTMNVLLSEKRNPQLGLAVGFLVLIWRLPFRQKLKWGSLVTLAAIAVILFGSTWRATPYKGALGKSAARYDEIVEFLRPGRHFPRQGTLSFHLFDLLDAWEVIKQKPLVGHGFGSQYERHYALLPVGSNQAGLVTGIVHSQYLHFWWKMGLAGLAAYLWLLIRCLKSGYKTIPQTPSSPHTCIALGLYSAFVGDIAMEVWGPSWIGNTKFPIVVFLSMAMMVRFAAPDLNESTSKVNPC